MNFAAKLRAAAERNESLLCIGLDPDPDLMAIPDIASFNRAIIEATADLVCCYKPNIAFYEQFGAAGYEALKQTLAAIPDDVPVLLDAKRGDIGNTARAYARAVFEELGADAVTVNPYMGLDSLQPFLDHTERGVMVLCRTSNPGARDLQDLLVHDAHLYEVVASRCRDWNGSGNVGLVVGATYPIELARVRAICPDQVILVPGVGVQQGDLTASVQAGVDVDGFNVLFNASRQITYASRGSDFAVAARREAGRLRETINRARDR